MILVDTSAWTEYLRGTGSGAHFRLRELLAADAVLGTTDVVHMELLAGSRTETDDLQLRRMLAAMDHVPVDPVDWETAARLHRTCERNGESVYSLTDCLVEEAGGRFTDQHGRRGPAGGSGLSSNGALHDTVLATLSGRRS